MPAGSGSRSGCTRAPRDSSTPRRRFHRRPHLGGHAVEVVVLGQRHVAARSAAPRAPRRRRAPGVGCWWRRADRGRRSARASARRRGRCASSDPDDRATTTAPWRPRGSRARRSASGRRCHSRRPATGSSRRCRSRARRTPAGPRPPTPEPLEEPPETWPAFHGLSTLPWCGLSPNGPSASSVMFSLPSVTAPAACRRATAVESRSLRKYSAVFVPHDVGRPTHVEEILVRQRDAVQRPAARLARARSASSARARASAPSASRVMNACRRPSRRAMRSRQACVASTAETLRAAMAAASSTRVRSVTRRAVLERRPGSWRAPRRATGRRPLARWHRPARRSRPGRQILSTDRARS